MGRKEEKYEPALQNKKIPVLTLDHKWHQLFSTADTTDVILKLEERLNDLLKRQGSFSIPTSTISFTTIGISSSKEASSILNKGASTVSFL